LREFGEHCCGRDKCCAQEAIPPERVTVSQPIEFSDLVAGLDRFTQLPITTRRVPDV